MRGLSAWLLCGLVTLWAVSAEMVRVARADDAVSSTAMDSPLAPSPGVDFDDGAQWRLAPTSGHTQSAQAEEPASHAATPRDPSPAPASDWTFRAVPYAWFTALNGDATVRGRTSHVDMTFIDIVDKSDSIAALMGNFEARNGRWAFYGDVVWEKLNLSGSGFKTRSFEAGGGASLDVNAELDIEMLIAEGSLTYEAWRWGDAAFDVVGGARYWRQNGDLSLNATAGLDVSDLQLSGSRATTGSRTVDWVDPLIGAQMRYPVAPGQHIFVRGDIGGFGAGSDFSWNTIAAYSVEFGSYRGVLFEAAIGYRALYVDYSKGEGRNRYEFDMLQHGPLLGLTMRF
jgi:hypothetical protein